MTSTSHVWRVFSLLVIVLLVAFATQRLLRPAGYGEYGNYRAGAPFDIMDQPMVYQGKRTCAECHAPTCEKHAKDVHHGVECEDCHGPGGIHAQFYRTKDSSISTAEAAMPKEYKLEGCLYCHRKLAARPRDFPQVNPAAHYEFLHVSEPETKCIECHSPHEPLFLLARAEDARIHPVIYECTACHDKTPEGNYREVARHPVVFVCADCHPAVVKDFAERQHASLRCTACHLFHRENDTAGRIYKNGNQRFCLLCHEKRPFKAEGAIPMIVGAEHLKGMAEATSKDGEALAKDPKACLQCHLEFIHDPEILGRRGAQKDG